MAKHTLPWHVRAEYRGNAVLQFAEVWIVISLVVVVFGMALGTAAWILCAPTVRLPWTIKAINDNWKAILVLAIPVFYRTARAVLESMKKFPFGMERREPEAEETKKTPPPSTRPEEEEEE